MVYFDIESYIKDGDETYPSRVIVSDPIYEKAVNKMKACLNQNAQVDYFRVYLIAQTKNGRVFVLNSIYYKPDEFWRIAKEITD